MMYLLQHAASLEAREEFMRRLKDDGRLFKIIEDNYIDIDDVLDLPTNNCYYSKVITIKPSLAKHLYNKDNLQTTLNFMCWNAQLERRMVELIMKYFAAVTCITTYIQ